MSVTQSWATFILFFSFTESLSTFSCSCWFNRLSVKDKTSLNSIIRIWAEGPGHNLREAGGWECKNKQTKKCISHPDHFIAAEFSLKSSRRHNNAPLRRSLLFLRILSSWTQTLPVLNSKKSHFICFHIFFNLFWLLFLSICLFLSCFYLIFLSIYFYMLLYVSLDLPSSLFVGCVWMHVWRKKSYNKLPLGDK